ncbi:AsmA family protein [Desertibaculum subflavum]|uniref:AsmA family protein n=1 Tax=Desertibaculum subflavum TaxID=2268458 RepID=UPI0034D38B9D
MMRKVLIGVGIVVVVLIAVVIAVPYLVPAEAIKDRVVAEVKSATGRDLVIKGPVKVTVIPALAVDVQDVAFSNAPGAKHKEMATLKSLQVELKWLPLIGMRAEVDRFVLVDPVIHLEVDRQGKGNWEFGTAKAAASAPAASSGGGATVSEINLGDVRLVNGLFTYDDAQSGASYKIEKANLRVDLPSLDAKFAAKGDLVYNSKKIDIAIDAGKLRDLMEGRLTPVNLAIGGDPLKLAFKGQAATGKQLKVDGDVDLAVPSVKELAAWAGSPIEAREKTMGPLSIKGKVGVAGPRYSFTNAQIALDEIKSTGEVSVDTTGARPSLKGKLDIAALDVNPYLPPEAPPAKDQQAGPTEWSSDPIDVAPLKAADAQFDLSVGSLKVRKIEVGKSVIAALLRNGRLQVDLKEMALYDGKGQGRVVLDGSGPVPAIEQSFDLQGIQVGPLLKAATDSERLTGKGALDYAVNGRGKSQKEIVSSLAGQGKIDFRDGAIKGFDLAEIVQAARDVKSAVTGGLTGSTKQTDFSELTGTFKIVNGIVSNDDLQMKSPLLRVTGKGTVEMPPKTVNYRLEPKLAATTKGQGGKEDATGITVPVIVTGPWHNISYRPDLGAMLKDAATGKAMDALKGAVPIPGGTSDGTTTPSAPSLPNPLKGILGK